MSITEAIRLIEVLCEIAGGAAAIGTTIWAVGGVGWWAAEITTKLDADVVKQTEHSVALGKIALKVDDVFDRQEDTRLAITSLESQGTLMGTRMENVERDVAVLKVKIITQAQDRI